ncbi:MULTISPECIES: AAA family ATPase [Amphritea]|uniref:MoxR-like ATPase n=1 Tax=Amphritea atlantica TaxID=355243 RepID=A0A1H9DLP1_9GAMM|nr:MULTISPECIES: MoxR family ATPase [Amphritea]MBN1007112.1 MoxR family ATPase [Amphritea pacifica]SEQ14422.1 MoxR-like ATPase [Amphritea atlantica]
MRDQIEAVIKAVSSVLYGKQEQIKLALTCIFSQGHLLIEDLPGMGKTTLAHALAKVLGLDYQRLQFTSDMLPADILGVTIFDPSSNRFQFHPGPVFTQLLLADEVNRTTPKTQSALLEAMEERRVSLDGQTHPLPSPFFVIATQNPVTQQGTFPLPESQLDRFLMRIELGYPDARAERELLRGGDPRERLQTLAAVISAAELEQITQACSAVKVSDSILDYLQRLIAYSRQAPEFSFGISPRGALALLSASRSWAYIDGRDYVLPEDLQQLLGPVTGHRLRAAEDIGGFGANALIQQLLSQVDVVG